MHMHTMLLLTLFLSHRHRPTSSDPHVHVTSEFLFISSSLYIAKEL